MSSMEFNINKFTPISVRSLAEGMNISYEIFYKKNGNYTLLCKDIKMTAELIDKFFKVTSPEFIIYIPNENYDEYVEFSNLNKKKSEKPESNSKKPAAKKTADKPAKPMVQSKNVYTGYNDVRSNASGFLDDISQSKQIPVETANAITETISTQLDTIEVSNIIDSINRIRNVDEYLYTHSINVSLINGLFGKWMKLEPQKINTLIQIGLLHDIGKLRVPPEILNKPGPLTKEEFEIMKKHPTYSYEMLLNSNVKDPEILQGVIQHHERVNGSGYPMGLTMDKISIFARITSIADVYDAMVAKRVHKDAHSPFEVLAWFIEGRYSELDINLIKIFIDIMAEELKGKDVLMSNGKVATVAYVNLHNPEFPYVQIDNEIVATSPKLHCVSLVQ